MKECEFASILLGCSFLASVHDVRIEVKANTVSG